MSNLGRCPRFREKNKIKMMTKTMIMNDNNNDNDNDNDNNNNGSILVSGHLQYATSTFSHIGWSLTAGSTVTASVFNCDCTFLISHTRKSERLGLWF